MKLEPEIHASKHSTINLCILNSLENGNFNLFLGAKTHGIEPCLMLKFGRLMLLNMEIDLMKYLFIENVTPSVV